MPAFTVPLVHDKPIFSPPRRHSPLENEIKNKKCGELRDVAFIKPAPPGTQYANNATMPAKKDPSTGLYTDVRMCEDLRAINEATVRDRYGMHLPEDLFRSVAGSTIFSKIDLRSGYLQIPVAEEDQPKTSFWWHNSLWCYTRLPFGMVSGPSHFQRILDVEIGRAGLEGCAASFVDDLIIHSATVEQHIKDVAAVLQVLQDCGLRAHQDKSAFGASVLEYLGHNLYVDGLSPNEVKVAAIRQMPDPTDVSSLRALLGFFGYYRCYCEKYSAIAHPLNKLLAKDMAWQWGSDQRAAADHATEGGDVQGGQDHAPGTARAAAGAAH